MNNYLLAKEAISNKYEDSPYYSLFVVSLFALLEKYPNYKDLIIYLFQSTNIYIEDDYIFNILEKKNINYVFFEDDSFDNHPTSGVAIGADVLAFRAGKLTNFSCEPVIICDSTLLSPTELLNVFLHEMNHLIKGSINSFYFHTDDSISYCAQRMGLNTNYYKYDEKSGNLWKSEDYGTLDEVINTIQATELSQNVFSLDGIIPDSKIQDYLNSLKISEAKEDYGYEEPTRIFRPLWEEEEVRMLIEDNIIEGNISNIITGFDDIMGDGAFDAMSLALDILYDSYLKGRHGKKYRCAKKYIKNLIRLFPKQKKKILSK